MSLGNNNLGEPFRVLVERAGPHSKGKKFFAGFATRLAADECAQKANDCARHEHEQHGRPLFEYTVEGPSQ